MPYQEYITNPSPITFDRFHEMLEVLPPQNWHNNGKIEYFQMCEYYTGNITSYFACYEKQYFTFRNIADLSVEAVTGLLLKCNAVRFPKFLENTKDAKMFHLTLVGFKAGQPLCGVERDTAKPDERFFHAVHAPEPVFNDDRLCSKCKALWFEE